MKQLETQLAGINVGGVGAIIGGAAIAGVVVGLAKIGQEFGSARVQIARETGLTGEAVDKTFGHMKDVLREVPSSIKDVTTVVDELTRRGVPLGDTFDTLAKQTLELAHITGSELGATVASTTELMNKFNVPLREQPKALDAIFKGYQQSGVSLSSFMGTLSAGGAVLQEFGFSIEESAALIATLDKAGISADRAMAGLRKGFGQIAKEGGNPRQALQNLVKEFSDGTPRAVAMADAMKLFGARSGAELARAIATGKFNVKDLLTIITDGKGGILETAAATRTFGEALAVMRNNALVALQPLASAVWSTIRQAILDAADPVLAVASAFANLGEAVAPLALVLAGSVMLAFQAMGPILDTFAQGLNTVAELLSNRVVQVLGGAALAVWAIHAAFQAFQAAGGWLAVAGGISDLNPVVATLVVAAAAVTVVGAAVRIFGGQSSAAAVEAKGLGKALFDTGNEAGLFQNNIASASQGLFQFLSKQDSEGKLKGLDRALEGTGFTLRTVALAAAGTNESWETLKASVADTSGLTDLQRKYVGVSDELLQTRGHAAGLTLEQVRQVQTINENVRALQQQRDALIKATDATFDAELRSGQLTQAQYDMAKGIEASTTAQGGVDAATQFANAALAENAAKLAASQVAALDASGAMVELKSAILDGTIGTNDATTAAAQYGITLDAAKQIITDTQAALKAFVSEGLAGLPDSSTPVTDWQKGIEAAFKGVEDAAGKGPKAMREAQAALVRAMDPAQVVQKIGEETIQIQQFADNIQTLLGENLPNAVRALLANPDKGAAAAYAKALVDNKSLAESFDTAQGMLTQRTADFQAFLQGEGAQQLLTGATVAGEAVNTGLGAGIGDKPVVHAHGLVSMFLGAVHQQLPQITADGKVVGAGVATGFGEGADLGPKTSEAVGAASDVLRTEVGILAQSHTLGVATGLAFDAGIVQGLQNPFAVFAIRIAATAAAAAAVNAANAALGITSPSKKGILVGRNFIAGVALGLGETGPLVTASRGIGSVLVGNTTTTSAVPAGGLGGISAGAGSSQIVLDLTVHLENGEVVRAEQVVLDVPRSSLRNRVAAEVNAQ